MSKTYSVQVKASNRDRATNERAITVIIMLATKQDYSWHENDSRSSRQNNSSRLACVSMCQVYSNETFRGGYHGVIPIYE